MAAQWSLSSVTYNTIYLSEEDRYSEETIQEYKKGYFLFEEIHLTCIETSNAFDREIKVIISFSEDIMVIKIDKKGKLFVDKNTLLDNIQKIYNLNKNQINAHLDILDLPLIEIKKINTNCVNVEVLKDNGYDTANYIEVFKHSEHVHTGLNVVEPDKSDANIQIVEKGALLELQQYI
jgi:hypothetical protein